MIRNPNDIQEGAKKIRMLIAGYPGIGKSTLALSAPNPLHIDVDFGIDRIEPRYRKPYIQPQSYDEILGDLTPINLQDFDTLVFDTGGKLISLISSSVPVPPGKAMNASPSSIIFVLRSVMSRVTMSVVISSYS